MQRSKRSLSREGKYNKSWALATTLPIFYAVTATVYHNRDYIKAAAKYHAAVIGILKDFLTEAAPLLWAECREMRSSETTRRKEQFTYEYRTYCCYILMAVMMEWLETYRCEGAYMDFYAEKLCTVAKSVMFRQTEVSILQILRSKPDTKVRFFYDSDAWDWLGEWGWMEKVVAPRSEEPLDRIGNVIS